jgi:HPr kinase/phosphorylase
MSTPPAVAVGALLESDVDAGDLVVEIVAGRQGLARLVRSPHVQKTGLALAGFPEYIRTGRVLVFGESEVRFLESRDSDERRAIAAAILAHDIPCILVTAGFRPVGELAEACERGGIPLLVTPTSTGTAIAKFTARLEFHLAERATVHGVLVDLLGLGVLILGESGIGKSECGLELVSRGHRLVADDVVDVRRRAESFVDGTAPATARFFMEVRGLGLIDIQALFGISAICTVKQIGLVVRLERWEAQAEHERLGIDDEWHTLVGVRVPFVRMPVAPGRSVATLVEVAARNELLKAQGYNAALTLTSRLGAQAQEKAEAQQRTPPETQKGAGEETQENARTEESARVVGQRRGGAPE